MGTYSYFRVYSGTLESDAHVLNVDTATDERVGQFFLMRGKTQEPVAKMHAGDIGAVAKLNMTHTGDTLGAKDCPKLAPSTSRTQCLQRAVYPKTKATWTRWVRLWRAWPKKTRRCTSAATPIPPRPSCPAWVTRSWRSPERMQRKFGVGVICASAACPTARGSAGDGRMPPQETDRRPRAVWGCRLESSLCRRRAGYVFENKVVGGAVPKDYMPAVEKGVGGAA